jgi:hypothetical protein
MVAPGGPSAIQRPRHGSGDIEMVSGARNPIAICPPSTRPLAGRSLYQRIHCLWKRPSRAVTEHPSKAYRSGGPMAGQIRSMIDQIIEKRSNGNPVLASTTQTKLILKGIDPSKYDASSPDDPQIIARLRELAAELSITL